MRHPVPPIREAEATLKERLQREHDGQRKPRLQMLYLLVTRQARDRQDVAQLLGVCQRSLKKGHGRCSKNPHPLVMRPWMARVF
jgi:hypothetical protein